MIVFLTVCTNKRKPILSNEAAEISPVEGWRQADEWLVGRYVIMPDHIHMFCSPARLDSCDLQTWVRFWKTIVSKHWPKRDDLPLWQQNYWDRQLRREESYGGKWEYVRQNPVRHGLVTRPEDWPYQGEMHVLRWE